MDTGAKKIKKICEILKQETLEPAKKEAEKILAQARNDARKIVEDAKLEEKRIYEESKKKIKEREDIFQSSLNLACKKSFDTLKQKVEQALFNKALALSFDKQMQDSHVIAKILSAIVKGIEKEGIDVDLQAKISSSVSKQEVQRELAQSVINHLKLESVEIGLSGGAEVKICDKHLTIDMSDKALKALIANFVREDFRSIFFASSN